MINHSYIKEETLKRFNNITPDIKEVGIANNGDIIFFEETESSFTRRHYGYIEKPATWNLVYQHNDVVEKVTKEYLDGITINFNDGYDIELMQKCVSNKSFKFNPFKPPSDNKKRTMWMTGEEYTLVRQFLKDFRQNKNNKNSDSTTNNSGENKEQTKRAEVENEELIGSSNRNCFIEDGDEITFTITLTNDEYATYNKKGGINWLKQEITPQKAF